MTVQPQSHWTPKSFPNQLHKVIEVGNQQNPPHGVSEEQWIVTWTVAARTNGCQMVIPGHDGACWSWYGPVSDFLNQFIPV